MKQVSVLLLLAILPRTALSSPAFAEVLKKLNVGFALTEATPYTHSLADDLMGVYGRELDVAYSKVLPKAKKGDQRKQLQAYMAQENKKTLLLLATSSEQGGTAANFGVAQKIYQSLVANEVSKVDAVLRYDPVGDVGFCFGRATMVHYLLLQAGVKPQQIAKIFAVGNLLYRDQLWNFHMATMVKGEKGKWWVIDSLFNRVLSHSEWMNKALTLDTDPKLAQLRFYVSDPRKFQPSYGQYRLEYFQQAELKPYFSDLFLSLTK